MEVKSAGGMPVSRIFISHSSSDNAPAIALRDWLVAEGWNDLFLDLDPERGIAAGERWERALNEAARRCEAVLFLTSKAWLASRWCMKELTLARFLLDVNRNCHGGFPRSRKSDSSAPSTPTEGSHGEGVLERLAGACGCDGRGGREPAGGRASAQPCTLHSGALARSVAQDGQRRAQTGDRSQSLAA